VLEPEVGIEPTTYRVQDGRSVHTVATTSNYGCGAGRMSTTDSPQ
jgi:hypothetical protein